MEVYDPRIKRRRISHPHEVNEKEIEIRNPNTPCVDEAQTTLSPDEISNDEMVVVNNEKETEESNVTTNEDISIESNTVLKTDAIDSLTKIEAIKESDNGHCDSKSRKKLLVLDVNGLIVDIVADPDQAYKADTIIGSKAVFKRPYCDEFLKFCFERFSVGVWTSRTRRNIERVLDFLMRDTRDQLLFCWDQSHCTETGFNTIENSDKPLVLKELKKLWEKEDANLPWEKGVYDESNTFLLDDSPYKALRNPPYTAIFPNTYSYRDTKDNGLGPDGDLRNYLEKLADSENVQKFIKQNPFGQQPITYNSESWKFYAKIIGGNKIKRISKKKLLIIDASGLLIDVVSSPREGYKPDTVHWPKSVFKRPYCDEFLKFCFERFNVGIWTSTSRRNMDRIIDYLMRDTQHKLLFCWDQSYCTDTGFRTVENISKPLILKEIKYLWEKQDRNLPWVKGEYDETNTLLIENAPYKALLNPPHTAIFPYPYRYWKTEDSLLGPNGELRIYLEKLAESENVQTFVEQNPFNQQRPITKKNLSWGFYQKVIRACSSEPQLNGDHPVVVNTSKPETDVNSSVVDHSKKSSEPEVEIGSVVAHTSEPEAEIIGSVVSQCNKSSEPEADINNSVVAHTSGPEVIVNRSVVSHTSEPEAEVNGCVVSQCNKSSEPEADVNNNSVVVDASEPETDINSSVATHASEPEVDMNGSVVAQGNKPSGPEAQLNGSVVLLSNESETEANAASRK